MFALSGHQWISKGLLPRNAGAVVGSLCKIKPVTSESQENVSLRFPCGNVGIIHFHTSVCQARALLKMMFTNKRKKTWYESPQSVLTAQSGFMKPAKKRSVEDSLRVRTLNTILYKSISELISSHEVNRQLPAYHVEITKVSLLADYSLCRIYWKTSLSSDRDCEIQQILNKGAPRIRYLLISQQILGSVPPLVFVLDKHCVVLKEVETLLKMADYGTNGNSEKLVLNEKTDKTREHSAERKKCVFGLDHDALYKQVEDYKQTTNPSSHISSASLTQEQLDMLAEIRRQRLIEKKKHNAKKMKDDDVTPKEFLLLRQLQKEQDEQHDTGRGQENSQDSEGSR